MTTPEQERARLVGIYSAKSDGELEELAAARFDLSEGALQALEAEMARRGLKITVAPAEGFDVPELNETVTVRQFRDLPEALLAKGSLESAGIQTYLVDDNMIRMDWFISNLLGGVKLKVRTQDAEAAMEILNQPIPETVEVEGVGEYAQPRCPVCNSLDVGFQQFHEPPRWACQSCHNEWNVEAQE
jgi:hypothetical protein